MKNERGIHPVKMEVYELSSGNKLCFSMKDHKVHATTQLIRNLEKMGVECMLNIT
jgi:hypothetical protein